MTAAAAHDGARDPSIDTLRFIALLGVVAIHAVVPYMRQPVPELVWPIRESSQSSLADVIFWWGRCAQSQLLFTVAGMVSARMVATRTPARFLSARLLRLGGPLAAGVVFILPLLAAVAAWGWMLSGRASWDEVRAWRFADPEIQRNSIGPAHLWFLEDLLIVSLVWGLVAAAGAGVQWGRRHRILISTMLLVGGGLLLSMWPEVLFAVPNSFVPDLPRIGYAATFFVFGACIVSLDTAIPRACVALLLAAAGASAFVTTSLAPAAVGRSSAAVAGLATGWLSVQGTIGLVAGGRVSLPAAAARLTRHAYPIYVIHLPIVCAIQVAIYPSALPALLAMLLSFTGGLGISFLLAELAVRTAPRMAALSPRLRAISAHQWAAAAVAFGLTARVVQYARNPDVWHDEAALLVNVIERGYQQLLAPLTFYEAAPPLFLWVERWIALHVSDSQWTMRLLPFGASCAALLLLWSVARAVQPKSAPVALLLMAASSKLIDHSVEAKPYALDVFAATLAIWLFVTSREWPVARRCAVFALLSPVLMWASYPSVFVVSGAAVALAVAARRAGQRYGPSLTGLLLVQGVGVAVLYAAAVRHQRSPEILAQWVSVFPAAYDPLTVLEWFVRSTIGVADYCFRPVGGVLIVPMIAGVQRLKRRGEHALIALLLVPLAFSAIAGIAWQYPYTGSRTMVFALPALALLAAEGLGRILDAVNGRAFLTRTAFAAVCVLPPIVLTVRDLVLTPARPQTAAAAQTVLAARRADEPVVISNWEYRYYLRRLGDALVPLDERPLPARAPRFLYIVHGDSAGQRHQRAAATLGDSYTITSVVDLRGVSVIEVRSSR